MKKLSKKQRHRDVLIGLRHRRIGRRVGGYTTRVDFVSNWISTNHWIDRKRAAGLNAVIRKRRITLILPETMNFSSEYEATATHITAIRKLSETTNLPNRAYKLASVNFDNLRSISSSAALVLTAELSKWDDSIRQRLRPMIDNWDPTILKNFSDIGFFDLFQHNPLDSIVATPKKSTPIKFVKYIKGKCGDSRKAKILKKEIHSIVGKVIKKWTFLHSGLTEAITNVSHHAYPDSYGFADGDKNWYLTGAYNEEAKEIKIIFYDQGIGIPKSLPASDVWERVLQLLASVPAIDRKSDEVLLKAAVSLERTRTDESDRGNGLQDLLEFIRQRENGYLSILSAHGLYKLTVRNGKESIKSEHFKAPIQGTLIIWNAILQRKKQL